LVQTPGAIPSYPLLVSNRNSVWVYVSPLGTWSYAFIATNFWKRPMRVEIRIRVIFTSRGVSETRLAERPANAEAPARKSRLFKITPPTLCPRRNDTANFAAEGNSGVTVTGAKHRHLAPLRFTKLLHRYLNGYMPTNPFYFSDLNY